ncbi:sodium/hydrogen exchanger [Heliocybe sulcata]|uniref:Sodium/hydrogen exchanger n=1 Tax=Heliocybe sulcata TaxID=5364 RepID=A0A5C3MT63_9AGAM|nr:sodium/hydrogen exchanger [Heliocybe sulcata]
MSISLGSPVSLLAASPSPSADPVPEEEEYYSSWSLFLVCMLLILSLWTSYYLQIKRIRAIHETLVAIFAGMFVGLIVRLSPGHLIKEMLTFRHTLFFNLLLPPIILNSGYELKQENFFRNFGSILTFAFLGTFISAVGVGVLVYIWSFLGLESLELGLLECLIFGSTLSATDPVTILAIFNQYKVDPKLYSVIFGESLLNDAVSIVMYETLSQFHGTEIYISSLFHGIGIFLFSFIVSMALGVFFGLAMSLLLKHSSLMHYPGIETCLVALSAYTCYFFSNGLSMSGIVSLLFCGITLKHYAYHTMSRRTQRATKYIFSTLAQLSENFIFVYLGLSLFTSAPSGEALTSYFKPLFIVITTVAVIFTRYAAVFPLSEVINLFHRHARGQRQDELPHSYQMMLFWAGLRGAVGVALAAGFQGANAQVLRMTVLVVVVLTVVLFGGTTARMLEVLGIRTGVEDEAASSDEDDESSGLGRNVWNNTRYGPAWQRYYDEETMGGRAPDLSYFAAQQERAAGASRIGVHYGKSPRSYNHIAQVMPTPSSPLNANAIFSAASSSDGYESDSGEVLPMATTGRLARTRSEGDVGTPIPGQDGKWFQALDERYLLPLFSNATASRTFHARKAQRRSVMGSLGGVGSSSSGAGLPGAGGNSEAATPGYSSEEEDGVEIQLGRPQPARGGGTGSATQNGGVANVSEFPTTPTPGDESRMERGFPSPMLRSSRDGGGVP